MLRMVIGKGGEGGSTSGKGRLTPVHAEDLEGGRGVELGAFGGDEVLQSGTGGGVVVDEVEGGDGGPVAGVV